MLPQVGQKACLQLAGGYDVRVDLTLHIVDFLRIIFNTFLEENMQWI